MKTLSSSILLTALAATILLPLRIESAVSLLSVAGVVAMTIADYGRRSRLSRVGVAARMVGHNDASFRLAA